MNHFLLRYGYNFIIYIKTVAFVNIVCYVAYNEHFYRI